MSAIAVLALLPILALISVLLVFCLPIWASVSIAFALAVLSAIGGGALLAKGLIVAAVLAVGVWLALRHIRRRRDERATSAMNWVAIPEAKSKVPTAEKRDTERRAA
jgi:hypothetical protein